MRRDVAHSRSFGHHDRPEAYLPEHVPTVTEWAENRIAPVLDDPVGRASLLRSLYEPISGMPEQHVPFRRAALAFIGWQVRRGLLNPLASDAPGSPWWRAVNERLLRDTAESRAVVAGFAGAPSSPVIAFPEAFLRRPSARSWYRAHNATIVTAYLDFRALAEAESRVERFFINLVLVRMLYAHALVAAPRLALSWMAPVAPVLGDPRLAMTGFFLSLSRVLPDTYPIAGELDTYIAAEHGFGRLLDVGIIFPRLPELYAWSAEELAIPEMSTLFVDGVPSYAWDAADTRAWNPPPGPLGTMARRLIRV